MNRSVHFTLLGAFALIGMLFLPSPARAEAAAKIDGDFTIQWRQMLTADQPAPAMTIGGVEVTVRPLPKDKPKDPPSAALFVGDALRSKTVLYPGKWYAFALVGRGGKTQLFVNGFPDATGDAPLKGDVASTLPNAPKIAAQALGDDEVLAAFRKDLRPASITAVGHRGVHKYAPENTRVSYVQAVAAGTPIVEIDTALTKDGHIVIMHDKTVDRTTNGKGKVADLTVAEITKLDAGSWKNKKYQGEPVPTLAQVAEVCAGGKAIMMLDLKAEGQGKAIADWLSQSSWPHDQVILAPWTDEEGVALRKHVPADVPMIRLTSKVPAETVNDAYFAKSKQLGFSGFSVNWQYLTEEFARAAQKNGMKVYVWTVNDSADVAGSALLGVDGIVTDDPANTMKLISQLLPPKR